MGSFNAWEHCRTFARERANGLNCTEKKKSWQTEESVMEPGGTDDVLDELERMYSLIPL